MTREVAKRVLKSLDYYLQNRFEDYGERNHDAMITAIKALEQEDILDKIRAEIEFKSRIVFKDTPNYDWAVVWNKCIEEVLEIIDKYKTESEEEMKFEIGKTYQHNAGQKMTIIGRLKTYTYGECLIGETDKGDLVPVGESEEHAINWHEAESEG